LIKKMPKFVVKESPWDSKLKQDLISHYRNLVEIEMNEPIPLQSSFLGIKTSGRMAEDLSSSNTLIPSIGSHGVFDDGIPFYHIHMQTLVADEIQRLEKCGVRLKAGKFSDGEDEQIRKNWLDYCEISGTDPDEVTYFMGVATDKKKKKGSKFFRAFMCRGMPDRSGIQVYRRAQTIFHPSQEDAGYSRPWSKEDLQLLLQLGPTGRWADIGSRLNRPRFHCRGVYVRMMQKGLITGDDKEDELKLLYKYITKAIGKDVVKAFSNGQLDALEQLIDWEKIAQLLSKDSKSCRKLYKKMKQNMDEAKGNSQEVGSKNLMKAVRKGLPKGVRKISRAQTKKKPYLKLSGKKFSSYIKALHTAHEEELKLLKKPYRLSKVLIASEALSEYDEQERLSILRRLNYVLTF